MTTTKNESNAAKYLVAKYIPDVERMEPRNIGVIVWSPEGVAARFLGERDTTGEVDGRVVQTLARSVSAYKQWIGFWRSQVESAEIVPATGGERVPRTAPAFVDALKSANKSAYCLVNGGFLLDRVPGAELPKLADYLYKKLVREPEVPRLTLEAQCERLIHSAQLDTSPYFKLDHHVVCPVPGGPTQEFVFDYAFENGTLKRLYQRVSLHRTQLRRGIHAAAWQFEKVAEAALVGADGTAALVYLPDQRQADPGVENAVELLSSVTRVVNVADEKAARDEFAALPALVDHI